MPKLLTILTALLLVLGSAGQAVAAGEHHRYKHLPYTNDWRTAVRITQRVFPGTESWLLSCSASEGSWGSWVPNRQGSGAGGWMQFMSGTFYAYVDDALRSVQRKKFVVMHKGKVRSWYSALGQALTAGYMRYYNRDGSHWYGSGCH